MGYLYMKKKILFNFVDSSFIYFFIFLWKDSSTFYVQIQLGINLVKNKNQSGKNNYIDLFWKFL
jgi:hypothetical protein